MVNLFSENILEKRTFLMKLNKYYSNFYWEDTVKERIYQKTALEHKDS